MRKIWKILAMIAVVALFLGGRSVVPVAATPDVTVSIDAPATAAADSDFTANVNISQVTNFDACNYDVSFNASVLRLDSVTSGLIGSTPVPVDIANELSPGTWTVVQNVSGLAGVSGSGYLAVLHFHVIGAAGTSSAINLSNGMLSNNLAEEIPATWVGDTVSVPDTTPPTVSSVSPAADATGVAISTTVSVTFSEAMNASTITTSSFTVGGVSGSVSYNSGTYTATFTPSADLSYETTYTATLSTAITDAAGNPLASAYSWSFTTTSAPVGVTVSIDAPATAATDSDFTANVNITEVTNFDACNYDVSFDASVLRLDSVTAGLIGSTVVPVDIANELSPGTWTVVENISGLAGVSGSGYLAVLHFHVVGTEGDTSAISLSNGMLSNNLAEEIPATWVGDSVIIGPGADVTPPTVSSVSPAADATGVAVTTAVTATFSEVMDESTITTSSFTVGGVSGSVSYNSGTYTATFAPSANLSYSTTYTANLSTAITDAAGNPLASAYSWSFTTTSAPVGVTVSIDAPAAAAADSDFTANVNISQVTNFDACNYDVSFNASVLWLDSVTAGLIGSTPVPVDIANELSPGTWTVVENISGLAGVSGSGYLAVLHFHVIGAAGTSSAINLSNGMLSNNVAEEIPATWVGDSVNVVGVDTTPPTVVSTSPAADATGVAISTTVSVTFSEAMNASTITTSSFTVGGVSGSVSYNSGTYMATFTPSANLSYSTTYTANLSTAITDAAGNPLASAYSWSFTTTSAPPSPPPGGGGGGGGGLPPDTTPPRISEVSATSITETTADITWRTHEKGDSQVEFWASPSNFSPLDPALVIEHLVHLTDLTPATMYHYRAMSKDRAGNQTVSDEYTFVTLGRPPAAAFTSSNLIISPSQVDVGEPVAISVSITNAGDAAGNYEVTLKINGVVEATEEVTLGAGTSQEVTFTTARDVAGTYTVEVDGLSGSFTVKEKPAPPTAPPSAPTPTPPTPPAPAPPAPTPPPSAVNWPLIGGIIGGVAAGIAISLVVRRRRAKAIKPI
jgi:stringent starvation protein B